MAGNEPAPEMSAQEPVPTQAELRQQRMDELKQKMDEAVAVENFEAAAQYRDRIRALTEEAGEPTCN
jgi:protein-arginine kinase activator protein McsA